MPLCCVCLCLLLYKIIKALQLLESINEQCPNSWSLVAGAVRWLQEGAWSRPQYSPLSQCRVSPGSGGQWSPPVQQQHTWHWRSRWCQPPHTSHSCTLSGAYRGEGVIRWPILFYLTKSERKHFYVFFAWFTLYVALKRVVVLIKIEFDCITAIYSQYSWFYFSCMVFCVCV